MTVVRCGALCVWVCLVPALCFRAPASRPRAVTSTSRLASPTPTPPPPPRKGKKTELSSDLVRRLEAETANPWRTVRQFLYGAFGFSASIGGFTALTQFVAAVGMQPSALPVEQTLLNVGVDFGVVGLCLWGSSVDSQDTADIEVVQTAPLALAAAIAAERASTLATLRVTVGPPDDRRLASIEALQSGALQHVIVLGGPTKFVNDALRDAIIEKKLFARAECVVVPVRLADANAPPPTNARTVDNSGFVALPAPADSAAWERYVLDELATAELQGAQDASGGIVIAMRRDGSVVRRGVGTPPWGVLLGLLG